MIMMNFSDILLLILKVFFGLYFIRHGIIYLIEGSAGYVKMTSYLAEIDKELKTLLERTSRYMLDDYIRFFGGPAMLDPAEKDMISLIDTINKNSLFVNMIKLDPIIYLYIRLFNLGKSNLQIVDKLFVKKINRVYGILNGLLSKRTLKLS